MQVNCFETEYILELWLETCWLKRRLSCEVSFVCVAQQPHDKFELMWLKAARCLRLKTRQLFSVTQPV